MTILALDTSMGACSAAVLRASGETQCLYTAYQEMPRGHAEALVPMIETVLRDADLTARDIDLIAATVGPGSFTGVRIAIAAARGLSMATGARLAGTDSLTVMAQMARDDTANAPFAVAVDARRGMLYLALYGGDAGLRDGPLLIAPEEAARRLPDGVVCAVGSGAEALVEAAARQGRTVEAMRPELQPSAAALAEHAFNGDPLSEDLRPLYLRPPDAKPQAHPVERR